jgi:NAD(P)H-hydrate epimerase
MPVKAVAEEIRRQIGDLLNKNILMLIGPGNNGGDGLVAARYLYDWGIGRVKIYLCKPRSSSDINFELIKKRSIHYREMKDDIGLIKFNEWLSEATAVVDAVFGTGQNRAIEGNIARLLTDVDAVRRQRKSFRIFALDLPSGLNANTGQLIPSTPSVDVP